VIPGSKTEQSTTARERPADTAGLGPALWHGQEVLPIGGFTGTQPSPILGQLRADIAAGRFHLVLAFPSADPRLVWIAAHCRQLPGGQPPFVSYYCRPADAG
jgi:hypothetical protein